MKNILQAVASLALIVAVLVLWDMHLLIRDVRVSVLEGDYVLGNVNDAAGAIQQAAQNTGELVTSTQPFLAAETRRINASTLEWQKTEASIRLFITRSNESLNGGPNVPRGLFAQAGDSLEGVDRFSSAGTRRLNELAPGVDDFNRSTAALAGLVDDPAIKETLANLNKATAEGSGALQDIHAETGLILGQTKQAFTPENKAKAILKMLVEGTLNGASLYFYLTH